MRSGGEADGLVAGGEVDVEPCDKRVDKIISAAVEGEGGGKSQVGGRAGVEVEREDGGGVRNHGFDLDGINKGFGERSLLEGGVVEAVDVVPDCAVLAVVLWIGAKGHTANLLILVLAVLDPCHENGSLVREDQAIRDQVFISGIQDGVQHGLVEQKVSHPLRDYDVHLREWQLNLFHLALEQGNLVRHAIYLNDLAGLFNDSRHIDSDYMFGTGFHSEPSLSAKG